MATRDDPRRSFLNNTNRKKLTDDRNTHHSHVPSPGNHLCGGASSSSPSTGPRPVRRIRRRRPAMFFLGEISLDTDPDLETALSCKDLMCLTVHSQVVQNQTGFTQQHESDKIKMNNDDSTPLVKKSETDAISASRVFKKKESATQPPNDDTRLSKRAGASTIKESKQLTPKGTAQPIKDPSELDKKSGVSRIWTPTARKPKTVESDGNIGTPASKHVKQNKETAQPHKDSAGLAKNGGTSRTIASKHPMQLKERTQHPKPPARLVKNIGTSIPSASTNTMEKKKAIRLPKDSTPPVKKTETTAGVASKRGTSRSLPPKPVTHKKEVPSDNKKQMQYIRADHMVWEDFAGFVDRIVPLEKSCLICDDDLAFELEYDPDMHNFNPAENAVLSCGHAFHSSCLRLTITEENCRDPTCIICASLLS